MDNVCHYRLHGGLSSHAHFGRRLPSVAGSVAGGTRQPPGIITAAGRLVARPGATFTADVPGNGSVTYVGPGGMRRRPH